MNEVLKLILSGAVTVSSLYLCFWLGENLPASAWYKTPTLILAIMSLWLCMAGFVCLVLKYAAQCKD